MVMNKKEKARMLELEDVETRYNTLLDIICGEEIQPDIAPPSSEDKFGTLHTGFVFNAHTKTVSTACSSSIGHSVDLTDKTTTQRSIWVYSTRELAHEAMMVKIKRKFYKDMIDLKLK